MNSKKIISIVLLMLLVISTLTPVFAYRSPFEEVELRDRIMEEVKVDTERGNTVIEHYKNYYEVKPVTIGDWTYTLKGDREIVAVNNVTGATASVAIDTSSVFEMSRTYTGGSVDYSVIRDNHWREYYDIASYVVLYSGLEVRSADSSTLYDRYYYRPTSNGTYTVRIALYEDDNPDFGNELLSTNAIPYYLAMVPSDECDILTYGPNEIQKIIQSKPLNKVTESMINALGIDRKDLENCGDRFAIYDGDDYVNYVYMVKDHYDIYKDSCAILMNDIVLNPIVVKDDGTVLSASYNIYEMAPLGYCGIIEAGTEWVLPYCGSIIGNGHSVYGFHSTPEGQALNRMYDSGKDTSGTIASGLVSVLDSNGTVSGVNMQNCYINAKYAGSIVGIYLRGSYKTLHDCNVRYSNIYGSYTAGGIVGAYCSMPNYSEMYDIEVNGYNDFDYYKDFKNTRIDNCTSNARVLGESAGGIVGYNVIEFGSISNCVNFGEVVGTNAGGIVGMLSPVLFNPSPDDIYVKVRDCVNLGKINGISSAGGIVGKAIVGNFNEKLKNNFAMITDCHDIAARYSNPLSIVGTDKQNIFDVDNCLVNKKAKSIFDVISSALSGTSSIDMTKENYCSKYSHIVDPFWSVGKKATCTEEGTMVKKCSICGEVVESYTIPATGHDFWEDDFCSYCGIPEDEAYYGATILVDSNSIVFIVIIVVCICTITVLTALLVKKRENKDIE